jgi:GNAT superfamily N-acetyltransferase
MAPRFRLEKVDVGNFDEFFELMLKLAEFEHLAPPDGKAKLRLKRHATQKRPYFEAYLGRAGGRAVGYTIFFLAYSSFLARPTFYLEDLFILEEDRKKGYGGRFFDFLVREAKRRGCGRMEWCVLNWNRNAIAFYEKLGASRLDEWIHFRLTEDKIKE